jgi:hypothetical protein
MFERYTLTRTGGRGCGGRKMAEVENENFGKDPHVTPAGLSKLNPVNP